MARGIRWEVKTFKDPEKKCLLRSKIYANNYDVGRDFPHMTHYRLNQCSAGLLPPEFEAKNELLEFTRIEDSTPILTTLCQIMENMPKNDRYPRLRLELELSETCTIPLPHVNLGVDPLKLFKTSEL